MKLSEFLKLNKNSEPLVTLVKQVASMDNIDDIEDNDEFENVGDGGYASVYVHGSNRELVVRFTINGFPEPFKNNYEQFVGLKTTNIVHVLFHHENASGYHITIMDKLNKLSNDEQLVLEEFLKKVNRFDLYKNRSPKWIELMWEDKKYWKLLKSVQYGVNEYHEITGEIYRDLHYGNVMVNDKGIYKLVDL
jgi:hypothetical protein